MPITALIMQRIDQISSQRGEGVAVKSQAAPSSADPKANNPFRRCLAPEIKLFELLTYLTDFLLAATKTTCSYHFCVRPPKRS